jgi:hypothetical protein
MAFGKGASGAGLEVLLEPNRFLLGRKLQGDRVASALYGAGARPRMPWIRTLAAPSEGDVACTRMPPISFSIMTMSPGVMSIFSSISSRARLSSRHGNYDNSTIPPVTPEVPVRHRRRAGLRVDFWASMCSLLSQDF